MIIFFLNDGNVPFGGHRRFYFIKEKNECTINAIQFRILDIHLNKLILNVFLYNLIYFFRR